ncbi:MAG: PIN domain-containing protein [Nitrososphaera sp.]
MRPVPKGEVTRFVWDTSALLNIKERNAQGYSPGHSLYKDFSDGWLPGPYFNIYPSIAVFELQASISRLHREGQKILRDFYIVSENSTVYPIDQELIYRCEKLFDAPGFSTLRGADLIFACIARLEDAYLVTLDKGFAVVASKIRVVDLNESRDSPEYRNLFRRAKRDTDAL